MKKLSLILLCFFWFSVCSADVTVVVGQPAVVAGVTPVYHNEMSSVTNPHTPTIGNSTTVNGSPSLSGGGIDINASGKNLSATQTWGGNTGTCLISLRPHFTGWPAATSYFFYSSSGNIFLRIDTISVQFRYGSVDMYYYTNTAFVTDQVVSVRCTWAISGANVTLVLYINDSQVATTTAAQTAVSPTSFTIGDYDPSGGLCINSIIDDFKIYDQVVTP